LESGNLSNTPVKLDVMMSALKEMRYDAVGVGEVDLRTCRDKFFIEAEKHNLTVLDARPDMPKPALPFIVRNVDGVRVGIVSFGGNDPLASGNEYARRKAMYLAYKTAREASDILIVLDQGNVVDSGWLDRNGTRLGPPDIVISGQAKVGLTQPQVHGRTHIVPTSYQAIKVGIVDVEVRPGEAPVLSCELVELTQAVAYDEKIKERIDAFSFSNSVPLAQQRNILPVSGKANDNAFVSDKPYYSPEICKPCHVRQYEDWARTKHSVALKTLIDHQGLSDECLTCHSEEYRRLGKVSAPRGDVGGVECATCHVDALPHGLERKTVAARSKVDEAMCLSCHTKERSPAYDKQAYFPKVAHPDVVTGHSPTASTSVARSE
jgi:hypothetical protein